MPKQQPRVQPSQPPRTPWQQALMMGIVHGVGLLLLTTVLSPVPMQSSLFWVRAIAFVIAGILWSLGRWYLGSKQERRRR